MFFLSSLYILGMLYSKKIMLATSSKSVLKVPSVLRCLLLPSSSPLASLPVRSFHSSFPFLQRQPLIKFKGPRSKKRGPVPPGTDSAPLSGSSKGSGAVEFWELEGGSMFGRLRMTEVESDAILSGGAL